MTERHPKCRTRPPVPELISYAAEKEVKLFLWYVAAINARDEELKLDLGQIAGILETDADFGLMEGGNEPSVRTIPHSRLKRSKVKVARNDGIIISCRLR